MNTTPSTQISINSNQTWQEGKESILCCQTGLSRHL